MTRVFDPTTYKKANGRRCALVYDRHGSYIQLEVLRFGVDNNISLLLTLAHSSHLCQSLDVIVFSSLKKYIAQKLAEIICYSIPKFWKFKWVDCYPLARPKGLSERNIKSGFQAIRLYPFNQYNSACSNGFFQ